MNTIEKLMYLFTKKTDRSAPLIIIRSNDVDVNVKEYNSIDEAIADLENDPNVPSDKMEKLKSSLKQLKNKTSIKIRNGEII